MATLTSILVGLVAAEHVYILILEMFLWTRPRGMKVFGTTKEFAQQSRALAANQGLYNGFLAAGLAWGLVVRGFQIQVFFLGCVIVAAIFGGLTVKRSILLVQGLPAALALLFLVASRFA